MKLFMNTLRLFDADRNFHIDHAELIFVATGLRTYSVRFCTNFEKNINKMTNNKGHSGEYGNAAKLVGKMSKSVMQLVSIHFLNWF